MSATLIEPQAGTQGTTPRFKASTRARNTGNDTPEPPCAMPAMRANIIARTCSGASAGPTPTARARTARTW